MREPNPELAESTLLVEAARECEAPQILDKERILSSSSKVKSILARFVQSIPTEIGEMKRAAEENDWARLLNLAHKFQGTAGTCGFPGLMDQAIQLQAVVQTGERDAAVTVQFKVMEDLGKLSAEEFERLRSRENR